MEDHGTKTLKMKIARRQAQVSESKPEGNILLFKKRRIAHLSGTARKLEKKELWLWNVDYRHCRTQNQVIIHENLNVDPYLSYWLYRPIFVFCS